MSRRHGVNRCPRYMTLSPDRQEKKRDWDRMRSLFIPGARLIPTGKRQSGEISSRVLTVEDYINGSSKPLEEGGFFEEGSRGAAPALVISRTCLALYESRRKSDDVKPFARWH